MSSADRQEIRAAALGARCRIVHRGAPEAVASLRFGSGLAGDKAGDAAGRGAAHNELFAFGGP
jgi:hypothetical protein